MVSESPAASNAWPIPRPITEVLERLRPKRKRQVSLVFPMFNEGENIDALRRRLQSALQSLSDYSFEIILVDDHSTDDTRARALSWVQADPRVRYIRLSRNFGSHAAIVAGLHAAAGDCAVFLAADLQDPPELIPRMLERWSAGDSVVWAVRNGNGSSQGSWGGRLSSRLFWRLMRAGARDAVPPAPADFALLDRRVIHAYGRIRSRNDSLISTIAWLGFQQSCVPYQKAARDRGRSGWTFGKKLKLCIDSIVGFSYWPIRAMSVLGIGCALLGFVFLIYTVWHRLAGYTTVPGWAGLMSAMLTGMGILMVMVGILGEYLWRVLDETRGRPKYVIEEMRGDRPTP
jgi:dolichol-phosphate mannosyltransferase